MSLSKKRQGPYQFQTTMSRITNKKTKGSHGLHQDSFKLQTMTALIKSFYGEVQILHGGSFYKKRPPWPPGERIGASADTPYFYKTSKYQYYFLIPAISSSMAVVSDLGLSMAYPNARSQTILERTPMARPIPKRTV